MGATVAASADERQRAPYRPARHGRRMEDESRPVPRDELEWDVEQALWNARKLLPRKREPGVFNPYRAGGAGSAPPLGRRPRVGRRLGGLDIPGRREGKCCARAAGASMDFEPATVSTLGPRRVGRGPGVSVAARRPRRASSARRWPARRRVGAEPGVEPRARALGFVRRQRDEPGGEFALRPRAGRPPAAQDQRSPRLNVTASKGRMQIGSSSLALAISTHWPSRSSNASRARSAGSTSHRCATPSRA